MKNMKNFACILVLLIISITAFSQTQLGTNQIRDDAITEPKLAPGALRPINGGALSNYDLTFGPEYTRKYTLDVTSDIALTFAASGHTADSYIYIETVPDGTHTVSFPANWSINNNGSFDPVKTQRIELHYTGTRVYVDVFNGAEIVLATLLDAAVLEAAPDDAVLTFSAPVTITSAGWSLSGSAGAVTISSVLGSGTATPTFDLSRDIEADEVLTMSYNPATGSTVSSTGNEISTITDFPVTTWAGTPPPSAFCDILACPTGGDYTTIQAASDAAIDGQTICICAGTYRETIVAKTGVTYRNVPGDIVTISGLNTADGGWTVHSGNVYKKTITLPVSNNISAADLTSNTTIMANQVFKDGTMMHLGRWPKVSTMADLLDKTKLRDFRSFGAGNSIGQTSLTDPGLPATGNLAGSHIFVLGWFIAQTRVITARSSNTISYPALIADPAFRRYYYITNHLDLLTQAGEWFYGGGILYVWQTGGGSPTGIEYKARNWGFDLRGKDNVGITGLYFIGCEPATGDASTDGCTIDNIRATYTNHAFTQIDPDMIYRSAKMHGIKLMGSNNTIKNSEFQYAASQLIWAGPNAIINNNLASDISYEGNYGAFVTPVAGAGGQQITYNTVDRVGRSFIDFGYDGAQGGQHLNMDIGYNKFTSYLCLNIDGGATYGARGVRLTGTRIHHNWISDNKIGTQWQDSYQGIQVHLGIHNSIYFDQGSGPTTVDHNVSWDAGVGDYYNQINVGIIQNIYNNTFAHTGPREAYFVNANTPHDVIRNNLFVNHVNLNWGGTNGNIQNSLMATSNTAIGGATNVYSNSPLFVGPTETGPGYELQSGSPARNIGVHIPGFTDGYEGAAPDAGAYEFGVAWPGGDPGYVPTSGESADYIIDNDDMSYPVGVWTNGSGVPPTFTMSYSPTVNAEIENMSFSGTVIKLYSEKYTTHGIVEVKIDGVRVDCDPGTGGVQDCDLYQNTTVNNSQLIGTWNVSAGTHTYEQKLVGENPSSTGTALNMFDYLLVTP